MTVFTSGYQGETIFGFLDKLASEGINAVVDIRQRPFSRKPGFSKKSLQENLKKVGIDYYHFQELGTPEPLREFLANKGDYESFFERYKSFIVEYEDSLHDIAGMGTKRKICILCFEKDPHQCHRKIVTEALSSFSAQR